MLRWALIFLLIGLVAGLLGFTSLAGASIAIAKIIFFVFMVLFMNLTGIGASPQKVILGGVLLGAVLLDRLRRQPWDLRKLRAILQREPMNPG